MTRQPDALAGAAATRPQVGAVVFDMDGVLLDSEPLYRAAWQQAAHELGYMLSDAMFASLIGRSTADSEASVRDSFGADFPLARFREQWSRLWRERVLSDGIECKPGVHQVLDFLDARSVPRALATSSDAEHAALSLRTANLGNRFETVVTGDQVRDGKPAPDIYALACRRLGVEPRQCVAIEDSDAGVHSAVAAGLATVLIPDLKQPARDSIRAAFAVLPSMHEALGLLERLLEPS